MSGSELFQKESIHNKLLEKKGILEQLQVPPPIISFIRKNALLLQIGAAGLLLLVLAFNGYQYYQEKQVEKSTAMLAAALKETGDGNRAKGLEQVLREYPRTQAGLWSRLELAHLDYKAGRYQKAIEQYKLVQETLGNTHSLTPIVLYSLALTYEADGKPGEALNQLDKLAAVNGFADPANLAMARIHEKAGDTAKAKEKYEKVKGKNYQELVAERLARLDVPAAPAAR